MRDWPYMYTAYYIYASDGSICADTPHPPHRSTPTMLKCLRLVKSDRHGMLKCLLRPIELLKEFLLPRISDVVDLQLHTMVRYLKQSISWPQSSTRTHLDATTAITSIVSVIQDSIAPKCFLIHADIPWHPTE